MLRIETDPVAAAAGETWPRQRITFYKGTMRELDVGRSAVRTVRRIHDAPSGTGSLLGEITMAGHVVQVIKYADGPGRDTWRAFSVIGPASD